MNHEVKLKLRNYAYGNTEPFSKLLKEVLPSLNDIEKKQILTECAMLATKHGNFSNLLLLIEQDKTILKEKESGIFRMSVDIESIIDFKKIIDYLFKEEYKDYIDVNALHNDFLKSCINKNKLAYIQYLIEDKQVNFNLNNERLLKTLVRNKDNVIFEYFVFNLMMPISEDLKEWFIENNYENQWNQISKRNLFINLDSHLKPKHKQIKVKKL